MCHAIAVNKSCVIRRWSKRQNTGLTENTLCLEDQRKICSFRKHKKMRSSRLFTVLSTALFVMVNSDSVFQLTDRDFDEYVRDKEAMLVDFYAPW